MKKFQLYSVMYLDQDGAEKQACYRGYKAAMTAAKAISVSYGNTDIMGDIFTDHYLYGNFVEREWAA